MTTEPRCTGHCCRVFCMPFSPEELAEAYQAWLNKDYVDGKDKLGHQPVGEIHLIAPMVRYICQRKAGEKSLMAEVELDKDTHFYTCAHLESNGDCGIYSIRPRMCVDYPYGERCGVPGCTANPQNSTGEPKMNHFYKNLPGMGNVAISRHAQKRGENECITDAQVEDVLKNGKSTRESDGIIHKELNGIRLVIIERPTPFRGAKLVKTMYRVEQQALAKQTPRRRQKKPKKTQHPKKIVSI